MSTGIATFQGKTEVTPASFIPVYEDADINITRFYGGKDRGVSIQLTLHANDSYIQMDSETARAFANSIIEALNRQ